MMEREVLDGLARPVKTLPPKFFYDQHGSELFDRITDLAEYYPTRTEEKILASCVKEVAELVGPHVRVVEIGSGSSKKTGVLLRALHSPRQYVPIDIAGDFLEAASERMRREHPGLDVAPVHGDYTQPIKLPKVEGAKGNLAFFPGSTIGNFEPADAIAFLRRIAGMVGAGGRLLLGVDLRKDPVRLHAAYNDAEGLTAQFNLNVLARINKEVGADFALDRFRHYAFYEPVHGRIEMHLVSLADQTVKIADQPVDFKLGETIRTEYSYKYTAEGIGELARAAAMKVERLWRDADNLFSVSLLRRD
jgi:dimethylhistidine N-methyltransferase